MPNIGPLELVVLLVIVLLIFGPKRLPGLGRQLGSGMREFKESITGGSRSDDDRDGDDADRDAVDRRRLEPGDAAARAEAGARSATTEPEVVKGEADAADRPAARRDA
jgi:sec-independent protein translocase protein TatA